MRHLKENITFGIFLLLCAGILLCGLLSSCATAKRIEVVTDTIYKERVREVPVVVHDSVYHTQYVEVFTKGDTVYRQTIVQDKVYVEIPVEVHDTMYLSKKEPYPVVEYVDKEVRGFFWWFGLIMTFLGLISVALFFYFKYKED